MSSSERVLLVPELAENILSQLEPRDLLLSQRVCRTWSSIIASSRPLQRALFFLPDWSRCGPTQIPLSAINDDNNLHKSAQSAIFSLMGYPIQNMLLPRAWPCNYPALQHSLDIDGSQLKTFHSLSIDWPARSPPHSRPAVLYPNASWRRMLLCQPPCMRLRLVRARPWPPRRGLSSVIEAEGGITMGHFYAEAANAKGWDSELVSNDGSWHFEGAVEGNGRG